MTVAWFSGTRVRDRVACAALVGSNMIAPSTAHVRNGMFALAQSLSCGFEIMGSFKSKVDLHACDEQRYLTCGIRSSRRGIGGHVHVPPFSGH